MFEKRGIKLAGLFDVDENVVGKTFDVHTVMHTDYMEKFCSDNKIDIAILTLPKNAVYKTAVSLASAGVKGFWNFSNTELPLKEFKDVKIENVHLGDSLMALAYSISDYQKESL